MIKTKVLLLLIILLILPSNAFALNPRITDKRIVLYAGEAKNVNIRLMGNTTYLSYMGFINNNFYKMKAKPDYYHSVIATYHKDAKTIRVFYYKHRYWLFEVIHLSPEMLIIQKIGAN